MLPPPPPLPLLLSKQKQCSCGGTWVAGTARTLNFVTNPCFTCTISYLAQVHGLQLGSATKSYASVTQAAGRMATTWFSHLSDFKQSFETETDRVYAIKPAPGAEERGRACELLI